MNRLRSIHLMNVLVNFSSTSSVASQRMSNHMNMMKLIVQDNVNAQVIAFISRENKDIYQIIDERNCRISDLELIFFIIKNFCCSISTHTQYTEHVISSNARKELTPMLLVY